jgi:hypothetical protein
MTARVVSSFALATTPWWSDVWRGGARGRVDNEGRLGCDPLDGAGDGASGGWMVEPDEETDSLRMLGWGDRDIRVVPRPSRSNIGTSEMVLFDRRRAYVGLGLGER